MAPRNIKSFDAAAFTASLVTALNTLTDSAETAKESNIADMARTMSAPVRGMGLEFARGLHEAVAKAAEYTPPPANSDEAKKKAKALIAAANKRMTVFMNAMTVEILGDAFQPIAKEAKEWSLEQADSDELSKATKKSVPTPDALVSSMVNTLLTDQSVTLANIWAETMANKAKKLNNHNKAMKALEKIGKLFGEIKECFEIDDRADLADAVTEAAALSTFAALEAAAKAA